ncbi:IclR family transcriptional regulator [Leifsonia shinshuensis]|nr:IclR family transcriptional regulator [Leifsonia shinshuensis]
MIIRTAAPSPTRESFGGHCDDEEVWHVETNTRTVERAFDLLAAVCDAGSLSMVEAARAVDLSPSTATRLLRTMTQLGFLRRDITNSYVPGVRLIQLGAHVLSNDELIRLCQPVMNQLAQSTGESIYLSIRGVDDTAVYVAMAEGTSSVRHVSWIGRTFPLAGSAAGQVLLGHLGEAGFEVESNLIEPDVTAIAAPVTTNGRVVAAMSLLAPTYRADTTTIQKLGHELAERTGSVSALLTRSADASEPVAELEAAYEVPAG